MYYIRLYVISNYNNRQVVMVVSGFPHKTYYTRTGGQCMHGRNLNVGMPVSLQPAHPILEYCNRTQLVSSINRQTTANEYRSIQGLAKIL